MKKQRHINVINSNQYVGKCSRKAEIDYLVFAIDFNRRSDCFLEVKIHFAFTSPMEESALHVAMEKNQRHFCPASPKIFDTLVFHLYKYSRYRAI